MAINDFGTHLTEVGNSLEQFRVVIDDLNGILKRHNHNGYVGILSTEFDGEMVTKAEYDAAMSSILNLIETWLPAGHGTNIDKYLFEVPELTP